MKNWTAFVGCDCNAENTELQTDGSFDCSAIDGKCTCKAGWTTYDCGIPVLGIVKQMDRAFMR